MNSLEKQTWKKLSEKLDIEYDKYIENLKTKTPEEIIIYSYETSCKAEIIAIFDPEYFDFRELLALSKDARPLDELYTGWMDSDVIEMSHSSLRDSMKITAQYLMQAQMKKMRGER